MSVGESSKKPEISPITLIAFLSLYKSLCDTILSQDGGGHLDMCAGTLEELWSVLEIERREYKNIKIESGQDLL